MALDGERALAELDRIAADARAGERALPDVEFQPDQRRPAHLDALLDRIAPNAVDRPIEAHDRTGEGGDGSTIYRSRVGAGKDSLDPVLRTMLHRSSGSLLRELGYLD